MTQNLNLDQLIGAAYVTKEFAALNDCTLLDCICRIETLGKNMPDDMLVTFEAEADKRGLRGELDLPDLEAEQVAVISGIEASEEFVSANKVDGKGREIGYIVGIKLVDGTPYAWVQNARRVDGVVKDFGSFQRSRPFKSYGEAKHWAYYTANQRIANLK